MIAVLFIYNESTDPYFNLAAEEFLVKELQEEVFMLWRNHNTIVVGRNQNTLSEIHYDYVQENNISVVRRMTGGGAVFHDMGNVNFTFIVNSRNDFNNYQRFTEPVLGFLNSLGVAASLTGRNDLVIGEQKISGNAQYMYQGRMLHHGTLLYCAEQNRLAEALKVSPEKFQSKGIQSVRSRVTNIASHMENPPSSEDFIYAFADYMVKNIPDCQYYDLKKHEEAIRRLRDEKYATWEWNFGYSPKYEFIRRERFPFGTVEIHMDIAGQSEIKSVKLFGDFFSRQPVEQLEAMLCGVSHEDGAIREALRGACVSDYIEGMSNDEFVKMLF